ncbi:cysteine desulfurase family protein [Bacillus sp. FJAT-44742]|uniref:cysteine desulfurase family protein n=1 Tax=Bacillus sp. FJAT-44742 TaxID=2014005 RepID=UPI000C231339|nr:cysteine desulfurase family protein [Bacillus sp. FJAT-44742]
MKPIYMDHAATSPVREEVIDAMLPFMKEHFGNPSSIHQFGRRSRQALDESRRTIAQSIESSPEEIIFTSGGTEADNLALIGYAEANQGKGKHIITTQIEHHAILHTCERLEKMGYDVTYLPVSEEGLVSVQEIESSLREDTILVSIMYGNNEVGTLQPIEEIGALLREKEVAFHTDAVQVYGLLPLTMKTLPVDMLSVSSHKINGPKGTGFLYVRNGINISPTVTGGEQERKRRAGTENVPSIVGFAKAAELAVKEQEERWNKYRQLTDLFLDRLEEKEVRRYINGNRNKSLPHILNLSFPKINVESMLVNLDLAGIAASSGSACTAGSIEPSHVLAAMYKEGERLYSSIRFSLGYGNSAEEIEYVTEELKKITERLSAQAE